MLAHQNENYDAHTQPTLQQRRHDAGAGGGSGVAAPFQLGKYMTSVNEQGGSSDTNVRVEWCSATSALLCSYTLASTDPFRNLFYTTNPTMYGRSFWLQQFGAQAAVLGDARALEESVTVSYSWRQDPGFRVAFSQGLFRHKRVDRLRIPADFTCGRLK